MSLPGHDAALGGSKERVFVKFDNFVIVIVNTTSYLAPLVASHF